MQLTPLPSRVGVIIPARNEEATIVECIRSVLTALDFLSPRLECWVVVVADSCTDQTEVLAAAELQGRGELVSCGCRSPGAARALGTDRLLLHFAPFEPHTLWLASTDADTVVPSDWIHTHLSLAAEGAAAVAGIVAVDSFIGHAPGAEARFLSRYQAHADGTHPHVHAANLGIRSDAYLDAGGWSNRAVGEDHCLWQRVSKRGWRTRSSVSSIVTTSGRLVGRAQGGFANDLRLDNCAIAGLSQLGISARSRSA